MGDITGGTLHRANYVLEFGAWRATCRWCGHTVVDANRRQAASQFRLHIRDSRVIDLRDEASPTTPGEAPTSSAFGELI